MCIKFYQKYQRLITGAVITVGVILLGTFVPSETEYSKGKIEPSPFRLYCCHILIVCHFKSSFEN